MSPLVAELEKLLPALRAGDRAGGELSEDLTAAVFRKNRENALRFLQTPYARRAVFVPQCLRSSSACRAQARNGEYLCAGCGACKIEAIARRARELGYPAVRILKGGSTVPRLLSEARPGAVLGISCGMESFLGMLACERAGVPAFCVPLSRAGCADTDVDLDDVRGALEAALP